MVALLLLVTSQSMAVTRGTMRDAAGHMVLCTGTGPIAVAIDSNGEPISPHHICPDTIFGSVGWLSNPFVLDSPRRTELDAGFAVVSLISVAADVPAQSARDPPVI